MTYSFKIQVIFDGFVVKAGQLTPKCIGR